ncbi:MAG: hypothetical protein NTU94_13220 [Planctomycetota bacterium]|nr:hypothetical protein [Planctomycetota bacterium]
MTERPTDHRNQDLTAFNLDVIHRRAGGRILWQPRIGCWLTDKQFAGEPIPAPYTGMTRPQIYRSLGCSNRIYDFGACFRPHEDPAVRITERALNETDTETLIETPVGRQRAVHRRHPGNRYRPETLKWEISDEAEMRVAAWREERRTWSWDQAAYDRLSKEWAGLGAPCMCMPRTNVQKLYLETMGVPGGIFALTDHPAACGRYFEAMAVHEERLMDLIGASPIEMVNFGDNVHSATLSPALFRQYVLPRYQAKCERLHATGKFVYAHWDGNCRPLLPFANDTGLDGIEAITPLPQGDVTLEETKDALGEMFLFDGIPAIYFDKTFSEKTLLACAHRCINLLAPNLVLGISDEISSTGDIERIRRVGESVDNYNASL